MSNIDVQISSRYDHEKLPPHVLERLALNAQEWEIRKDAVYASIAALIIQNHQRRN